MVPYFLTILPFNVMHPHRVSHHSVIIAKLPPIARRSETISWFMPIFLTVLLLIHFIFCGAWNFHSFFWWREEFQRWRVEFFKNSLLFHTVLYETLPLVEDLCRCLRYFQRSLASASRSLRYRCSHFALLLHQLDHVF